MMVGDTSGGLNSRYDTIVVGAGLGGLVAACMIARSGQSVLLLERSDGPGGNTGSIGDGVFRWDVGPPCVGDGHEGGVLRRILKRCGAADVELHALDDPFDEIMRDGDFYHYYRNRSRFFGILKARFPAQREGMERYERLLEQAERFEEMTGHRSTVGPAFRHIRNPLYARYAQRPFGEFLNASITDRTLRAVITAQHPFYLDDPARIATGLHAAMHNHMFRSGLWYPLGGMGTIARSLEDAFLSAGGTIAYGATAEQFEIRDSIVRGVHARFVGDRHSFFVQAQLVVSNADFIQNIHKLIGAEAYGDAKRYTRESVSFPKVSLHLGLAIPPSDAPFAAKNHWYYEGVEISRYYEELHRGVWPPRLMALMSSETAKSARDSSQIAPDGYSTLTVTTPAPKNLSMWSVPVDADTSPDEIDARLDNAEFRDACAAVRERLLAIVDARFPGVTGHIVAERMMTPPEYAATYGTTYGTVYGLTGFAEFFGYNRPGARTNVSGLYLCGPSIRPGYSPIGAAISGMKAASVALGPEYS